MNQLVVRILYKYIVIFLPAATARMSVYATFENAQIQKAQDVVASFTATAKALADKDIATKLTLEPHCRARPAKKAILRGYSLIPKVDITTYQEQNREYWKKVNFVAGKGVKEGKRKYHVNAIIDGPGKENSIKKETKLNKDALKAAIMYITAPKGMMTVDEYNRPYASSKGFHECILGTVSKKFGIGTGDMPPIPPSGPAGVSVAQAAAQMQQVVS